MSEKYGDSAYLEINGDQYIVHGYNTDTDITVTRPLKSLFEFELEEIDQYLEDNQD